MFPALIKMNSDYPVSMSDSAVRILIADDQPDVLKALKVLLKGQGYETTLVASPDEALESVKSDDYEAILIDLNYTRDTTSGREGLELRSGHTAQA